MRRVAFRVDAAPHIGSGHVMRSLTLARALAREGCTPTFVMRARAGDLCERVRSEGFDVIALPAEGGADNTWLGATLDVEIAASRDALADLDMPLLVVDHYGLDARWEDGVRSFVRGIVVLDDLADRAHRCDALIDAAPDDAHAARYRELAPASCALLLGCRYALLREAFRAPMRRRRERDGSIARVLVSYGWFDADDATSRAVLGLARTTANAEIDVVLPPQAPHADAVRRLCEALPRTHFLGQVEDMAERMERADLALGAGGAAALERCAMGLPTILSALADNQRVNVAAIVRAGAACSPAELTPTGVEAEMARLLRAPRRVAEMARAARALMGDASELGTDRVVRHLMGMTA